MKCINCRLKDAIGETKLCDPCRLKKWRKDNPSKVKAYANMRYKRDIVKIKVRAKIASNNYYYGGNRDKALDRDNHTCQTCGVKEEDCEKMDVHHIDRSGWGKPQKDKNNNMENLISLCSSCHGKIHNPQECMRISKLTSRNNNTSEVQK